MIDPPRRYPFNLVIEMNQALQEGTPSQRDTRASGTDVSVVFTRGAWAPFVIVRYDVNGRWEIRPEPERYRDLVAPHRLVKRTVWKGAQAEERQRAKRTAQSQLEGIKRLTELVVSINVLRTGPDQ